MAKENIGNNNNIHDIVMLFVDQTNAPIDVAKKFLMKQNRYC